MPASSGNAQSSSSIITPLSAACALSSGSLEQLQDHRLVLAEHVAGGDAEQQAVADLAGGAGDGDADGCFHCGLLERKGEAVSRFCRTRRRFAEALRNAERGGPASNGRRAWHLLSMSYN